jgi:Tol biopolymer transport system component/DNA-binding winged helix-turn-helix (wHTH) protein
MPPSEGNSLIRFGLFEVNLQTGELRRNGNKVRLQEQPFQLLALLLQKRGEIVTREELRASLWPSDTFVDFDHGLNAAIKRLRDALGDSADNPRFVETLARRGYRFITPIKTPQAEESSRGSSNSERYWLIFSVAFAVVLLAGLTVGWIAGRKSVSALNPEERRLTGNPENDPVLSAAISPDGKYLAFADRTGMFLRMVSSGETHPIGNPGVGKLYVAGKESGLLSLSWFPDGSHVLFTRTETESLREKPSLWVVSVFGGQPRPLIDDAKLGAVSPDGAHLAFVRGDFGHEEIWQVRSDGTEARKILGERGANVESLVWSPDGRAMAFTQVVYVSGWNEPNISLRVVDLATGRRATVVSTDRLRSALVWAHDGRLIYSLAEPAPNQNDTNLWVVRVDAHGNPSGQAIRLTAGPDAKLRASISTDGKRLTFLRRAESPVVYVSETQGDGRRVSPLHRLSLDERENYPYTWTPDSKSVIFASDRDGVMHLFKQGIDQAAPDLLVGGDRSVLLARLNPSGSEILYILRPGPTDEDRRMQIMRMPLYGGTPQFVLAEPDINNLQCARLPSTVCIFSEYTKDHVGVYQFDPLTGHESSLKQLDEPEWYKENWTLSPDGSAVALAKHQGIPGISHIRLFPLGGGPERELTLQPWAQIACLDWAADGRSLWVNALSPDGVPTLLNVDLEGRAQPVLQESEKTLGWAIPSPDGRHLAIWEANGNSNAWLLQGF